MRFCKINKFCSVDLYFVFEFLAHEYLTISAWIWSSIANFSFQPKTGQWYRWNKHASWLLAPALYILFETIEMLRSFEPCATATTFTCAFPSAENHATDPWVCRIRSPITAMTERSVSTPDISTWCNANYVKCLTKYTNSRFASEGVIATQIECSPLRN